MWQVHQVLEDDNIHIARLNAELPDARLGDEALAELLDLLEADPSGSWLIDLSGIGWIGSQSLARLLHHLQDGIAAGARFAAIGLDHRLRVVMQTIRIEIFMRLFPDEARARAWLLNGETTPLRN